MVTRATFVTMSRADKSLAAGEFKAMCLAGLDEVETRRRSFVITKRGRPVARVVPLPLAASASLHGSLLHDDGLLDPVDVAWETRR